jgi:anti-sigma regulatory factor (Ser/Thr protein kinase)
MMKFDLNLENLHVIQLWVLEKIKDYHLDSKFSKKIQLIVEEVLVNIFYHAYDKKQNTVYLEIETSSSDSFKLIVKDKGPYFDPTSYKSKIDKNLLLEEKKEGGIGLLLVKEYAKEIKYNRDNNLNVLILTINLDPFR